MDTIQLKDFLNFKFLSNICLSKDKKTIIFQTSVCDEKENTYKNNLYMIRNGVCTPLTNSNQDGKFLFLDNDRILFTSTRCKKDKEKIEAGEEWTSFYEMSLTGGEARKKFSIPLTVSYIEKLEEHTYFVIADYDLDYSVWGREEEKEKLLARKKADADYKEFTKIPFYANGAGFVGNKVTQMFLYNEESDSLQALSDKSMNVETFDISADKKKIIFSASAVSKKPGFKSGIYEYDLHQNKVKTILEEKEYAISDIYFFGEHILFVGNKEYTHGMNEDGNFYQIDAQGNITLLYENTDSLWNSVGSDARYGGGRSRKLIKDTLYYLGTSQKDGVLRSIDTKGNVKEVIHINGSVDCFDIVDDCIVFVAMKDGKLQEIYHSCQEEITCLSAMNTSLDNKYVANYERVTFKNDGIDFMGWVLLPKDYDPNKTYPAILDIHGGPKTAYGEVYYHEMQVWANLGYFVFFTNPRGSDGQGYEFMDIFGKYGTIDYDDLMKFTDVVLETYPAIDKTRLGVTGGSYGGYMSNWIITHTDRFKCAATQRSISNWVSFYGTSDIGSFFVEDQIHGNIYDSVDKLWEHSPLKYAKNIKTPTLFIHSDEDYRCPLEQGLQLYTAMVDQEIDAKFVLFHGENHELSRSGKPQHRIKRLEEITNWMEKYLK